jgi:predicted HTH domain antitoxin
MSFDTDAHTSRTSVTVDLPAELLDLLAPADGSRDAAARLSELAVIELFREERISMGRAARLLGFSPGAFVDLLGRHGVPYLDDSEEELRRQVEASARHRQHLR